MREQSRQEGQEGVGAGFPPKNGQLAQVQPEGLPFRRVGTRIVFLTSRHLTRRNLRKQRESIWVLLWPGRKTPMSFLKAFMAWRCKLYSKLYSVAHACTEIMLLGSIGFMMGIFYLAGGLVVAGDDLRPLPTCAATGFGVYAPHDMPCERDAWIPDCCGLKVRLPQVNHEDKQMQICTWKVPLCLCIVYIYIEIYDICNMYVSFSASLHPLCCAALRYEIWHRVGVCQVICATISIFVSVLIYQAVEGRRVGCARFTFQISPPKSPMPQNAPPKCPKNGPPKCPPKCPKNAPQNAPQNALNAAPSFRQSTMSSRRYFSEAPPRSRRYRRAGFLPVLNNNCSN